MTSKTEKLLELCWLNPFSARRIRVEQDLLGEAYIPVNVKGGRQDYTGNIPMLLKLYEHHLSRTESPHYKVELAAFIIFHQLVPEMDCLIRGELSENVVWASFEKMWSVLLGKEAKCQNIYPKDHLFAYFYQLRRAFHWIYRYVIGSSPAALGLRERIWESIFSADLRRYVGGFYREINDVHTLITGPSGSGKGIVARAIGLSRFIPFDAKTLRFLADPKTSYLSVNVATLSSELMESELFGHVKGAFTGAIGHKAGFFESAGEHGVLFLDEIGEAELSAQAKLLTVLQERTFQRVGDTNVRQAEGRVVTATNRDIEGRVTEGKFREDLYFRLSADRLETLSLKQLIGGDMHELKPMVEYVMKNLLRDSYDPDDVFQALEFIDSRLGSHYEWPGNFRELEQCLRNFLIHRDYQPVNFMRRESGVLEGALNQSDMSAEMLLSLYAKQLYLRLKSYKAVGQVMDVDQRTAKRYVES